VGASPIGSGRSAQALGRDKKTANALVGRWYAGLPEKEWTFYSHLQAVEYLVAAEDGDAAWPPAHRIIKLLRHMGRYHEALRLCERVLEAKPTGASRGLALTFQVQLCGLAGVPLKDAEGRLQEASRIVDEEDRSFVLNELGSLYNRQGNLNAAAQSLKESVAVETRFRGTEEHPSVAASLHALAGVLRAQGDLPGARDKLERVLAIELKVYGTRHHYSTAITETDLGALLIQAGEHERAAELLAHAFHVFLTQLGPEHPLTRQLAPLFQR
jgi:hypothetical protein